MVSLLLLVVVVLGVLVMKCMVIGSWTSSCISVGLVVCVLEGVFRDVKEFVILGPCIAAVICVDG